MFGEFLDSNDGVPLTNRIRAQLLALQPICAGDQLDCFVGSYRVDCRINRIDAVMEGDKFIVRNYILKETQVGAVDILLAERAPV